MDGVLVMDKPAGMTSHDVVARVRKILHERSVGHLGTLDPMATGVLPLVVGRMTRLAQFFGATVKTYEGEIQFGFATDTYDREGEASGPCIDCSRLTIEDIRSVAAQFTGPIAQLPPPFSAKKIAGVPAYKLARKKQDVELAPVQVQVHRFDLRNVRHEGGSTLASFEVEVSAGTYIRSLAHDLGRALDVGGHLYRLRRVRSGAWAITQAVTLEKLAEAAQSGCLKEVFVHPRKLLPEMPSVTADIESLSKIRHGNAANLPEMSGARLVKVFANQRDLVAIATRVAGTLFQPKVVLASAPDPH